MVVPSPSLTDILVAAFNQLTPPTAWSRRAGARNYEGIPCDPCSTAACSWCLWGALESQLGKIAHEPDRVVFTLAIEAHLLAILRTKLGLVELDSLQQFSDDRSTTHEDVLELLDVAALSLQPRTRLLSSRSMNAVRA